MRASAAILICLLMQTGCASTSNLESSGSEGGGLSTHADEQGEKLQQLRQRYQQARATFAKTKDYGKAYRESIESAHELISALLNHWTALPEGSPEDRTAEQEIKTVFKDLAGHPNSEKYNLAKSFMARTTWPLLAGNKLTQEQAALLVELNEPQALVRKADNMARSGERYESIGWDVQSAYALALIRSGDDKQARAEITILHKKVSMQYEFNPEGRLDYGPEAGEGRFRNHIDYLQLCEILHGLQAAISNDREDATKRIENGRKLRKALSPEAAPLVTEIARRVRMGKD